MNKYNNLKFLLIHLTTLLGLLGGFISATLVNSDKLLLLVGKSAFIALLSYELLVITVFGLLLLLVAIKMFKSNK